MVDKVPQGFFVKSAKLYALSRSLRNLMTHRQNQADGKNSGMFHKMKFATVYSSRIRFEDMRRYGMYTDDIWAVVAAPLEREAVNRLTDVQRNERLFRFARGQVTHQNKAFLPTEEWISHEQDLKHQPFLDRLLTVVKEQEDYELFRNQ